MSELGTKIGQRKTVKILLGYLWPKDQTGLRYRVVAATACLLLAKILNVYIPFLYKHAVDKLSISQTNLMIVLPVMIIMSYGLARIGQAFFSELRDFIFVRVARYAQRQISLHTFKHLHELSLAFHLERQTGGLSRFIERGARGVEFVLQFMTFNILPTLIEILMVTAILFYKYDWTFGAITFVTVVSYIAFTLLLTEWRTKYRREMNEKDSEANSKAIDSLINYETVKYFGNEEHELNRYDQSLRKYENAAIVSQQSLAVLNFSQAVIISVGLVAVMILAGRGVVNGSLTLGDFVLVNTFLIQLYLPLNFLGFVYREIKHGLIDMEKMFQLLFERVQIQDKPEAKIVFTGKPRLTFDHVSFSYNKDRAILHDISFDVPPGKTCAIVGPSGSGKSTIARLLFRFYDVNQGGIFMDGDDIRNFQQKSLRAQMGIVPQDTVLFNDTIYYNIHYGHPGATVEQVYEAARLAQIHDFVMSLPEKYETRVGERGLKLSGGEKQRVAIARTILKNPSILIFDEATSALDTHTEKAIQKSLDEVSRERTTIVIAHRLSTIVNADEILVLKAGKIVERGLHHDLLTFGGEYAQMWKRQQEAQKIITKLEALQVQSTTERKG
jgi:ABC-type transport system involved in Fe-S cluster assembly fused permease/ATPase subunit